MAANNLGTAYIKIAPQMEGIQSAISNQLQKATSSTKISASSIAVGTVISKGISTVFSTISNSLDTAVKRTDILNNFPKVMKNLGVNTADAEKAIKRLSDGLDGLPTTLQDGAMAVQRFTSRNSDVQKSTEIFLALNNAILAGGASTEIQISALEQMSQAYAKGKPDMMEWRTMMMAMPAQMNQVAKSMGLGENAADKLGEALRKGEISMDDFMAEIIKLNTKGVGNLASFEDQARDATAGIGTAMTNLRNRVGKAVSSVIQAFGSKDISSAINKFSSSFAGIADWINENIVPIIKNKLIPIFKEILKVVKGVVEFVAQNKWVQTFLIGLLQTIIAFKAVSAVKNAITGVITPVISLVSNIGTAKAAFDKAYSAGLSFSSAMKVASSSTTGLTSSVAGATGNITSLGSKIGEVVTKLASLSGGWVGLGGAIAGISGTVIGGTMIVQELARQNQEAAYKAREFASKQINLKNAMDAVNKSTELGTDILTNYKDALSAQNSAELDMLNAKKLVEAKQKELNSLMAQGKQGTDDYRIAELELQAAQSSLTEKTNAYTKAQEDATSALNQYKDNSFTSLNQLNLLKIATEAQSGQYNLIASQLDDLSSRTITYKDANGQLVQSTKEDSASMAEYMAQRLAQTDETWKKIVDIATEKGISFVEASRQYAQQAGVAVPWNFSMALGENQRLATDATQNMTDQIAAAADMKQDAEIAGKEFTQKLAQYIQETENVPAEKANKMAIKVVKELGSHQNEIKQIGVNITQGTAVGILDKGALTRLKQAAINVIKAAIASAKAAADEHSPSKKTAEIGKFLSLGLAQGIDDYAGEAVSAAEEATRATLDAFNGGNGLGINSGSVRPYSSSDGLLGGNAVTQYNTFNQVDSSLDMNEISKRLGWQVSVAL